MVNLLLYLLTHPLALFRYITLDGKYRYALKNLLRGNIKNSNSIAYQIVSKSNEPISIEYKGEKISFRNEIGAVFYMTKGIQKLEKLVDNIQLNSPKVLLDAGGNIGLFSYFFKKRFPNTKVYIIEPSLDLLPIIKQNLAPWENDVIIIPKALSAKSGTVTFFINKKAAQTNSMHREAVTPFIDNSSDIIEEKVECTTLKDILVNNNITKVDLLKIDIQGGEYPTLSKSIPQLEKISKILAEVSFLTEDNVQLCALLSENYSNSQVLGEVKMGADILFSK